MSVGAITGISFHIPPAVKVAPIARTRRVTRGGRVKGSYAFRLPDDQGHEDGDRPKADPAVASTSAATLAALASLTRGG